MGCDGEQGGEHPERPPGLASAVEGREQRERARERAEQEEAVHPPVDAVEEEHPARGEQHGRDQGDGRPGEPAAEHGDERQARERERRRGETQAAEAEAEVGDSPCDEEVERSSSAIPGHVLDHAGDRVPTDEERERLVLVRRPGHQLVEEEGGGRERDSGNSDPEPARDDPRADGRPRGRRRRGLDVRLDPLRHRVSAAPAGRLAVRCRSTSTVARTGTRSRCSSG